MAESENFNMLLKEIKLENIDTYGIFIPLFGLTQLVVFTLTQYFTW